MANFVAVSDLQPLVENASMFNAYLVISQDDFKKNSAVDITPFIKKQQGLDYIPWGVSLSLLREYNANLAVGFEDDTTTGHPFFDAGERGLYLKVYVYDKSNGKRTPSLIYAVRDMRKKATADVGMDTITNQQQRAVAKVIAQEVGFGWSLYSKFDESLLEMEEAPEERKQRKTAEEIDTTPTPSATRSTPPVRKVGGGAVKPDFDF